VLKNMFSSKIKNNIFPPICAYRAVACILGAPASADKLTVGQTVSDYQWWFKSSLIAT